MKNVTDISFKFVIDCVNIKHFIFSIACQFNIFHFRYVNGIFRNRSETSVLRFMLFIFGDLIINYCTNHVVTVTNSCCKIYSFDTQRF